jgi:hypothetical protein
MHSSDQFRDLGFRVANLAAPALPVPGLPGLPGHPGKGIAALVSGLALAGALSLRERSARRTTGPG